MAKRFDGNAFPSKRLGCPGPVLFTSHNPLSGGSLTSYSLSQLLVINSGTTNYRFPSNSNLRIYLKESGDSAISDLSSLIKHIFSDVCEVELDAVTRESFEISVDGDITFPKNVEFKKNESGLNEATINIDYYLILLEKLALELTVLRGHAKHILNPAETQ